MKKIFYINLIISTIITLIGFVVNLVCLKTTNSIPLAMHLYGGEISESSGFGWNISTIYPLTNDPINNPNVTTSGFSIISLLVSFICVFVVASIIGTIFYFVRKNVANK